MGEEYVARAIANAFDLSTSDKHKSFITHIYLPGARVGDGNRCLTSAQRGANERTLSGPGSPDVLVIKTRSNDFDTDGNTP
jgi:hypothetical protein